ncbi:hypothetical protein DID88_010488 [Monilinia fructigena]|uniref:Uncharacterized protein n=1 Tax=Monilinia fructigena TaxID=38457 RepID=A0A395IS25_9HELO|nr:hypothetical protein DID88_010488 [Monilinia fructigena]
MHLEVNATISPGKRKGSCVDRLWWIKSSCLRANVLVRRAYEGLSSFAEADICYNAVLKDIRRITLLSERGFTLGAATAIARPSAVTQRAVYGYNGTV